MAKHKVKANVLFVSDKDGVTHAYRKGSEVDLTAEQAERFEKLGALESNDERTAGEERQPRAARKTVADKPAAEAGKE